MTLSNFEQGDIVVATLMFSEQVGAKTRPALVISNSNFNQGSDDIILLKISSKAQITKFDVPIRQADFIEGELKLDSKIIVDNPVTTYKNMISAKAGKISQQKLQEVKQKIKELFEI